MNARFFRALLGRREPPERGDATASLVRRLIPDVRRPAFYAILGTAAVGHEDSAARWVAATFVAAYWENDWSRLRAETTFDALDDDYVAYAIREYERVRVALAYEPYDLWSPRRLDDVRELPAADADALFKTLDAAAWKPL